MDIENEIKDLKENPAKVINWLKRYNNIIQQAVNCEYLYDIVVKYMGENYKYIGNFYKKFKSDLNDMKLINNTFNDTFTRKKEIAYYFKKYKIKEDSLSKYKNKIYYAYLLQLCKNGNAISKNKLSNQLNKKKVSNKEIDEILNTACEEFFLKEEYEHCLLCCKIFKELSIVPHVYSDVKNGIIRLELKINKNKFKPFFTGGYWYERYVYITLIDYFKQNNINYSVSTNTKITFTDKKETELDIFFLIDEQPLWVECKIGDISNVDKKQIDNFIKLRKSLNIPANRLIVIFLDENINKLRNSAVNFGWENEFIVANRTTFLQEIKLILEKQLKPGSIPQISPPPIIIRSKSSEINSVLEDIQPVSKIQKALEDFLTKKQVKPVPEYRKIVIEKVIELLRQDNNISIIDLINKVKISNINTQGLSNNKKTDIIDEIFKSGNFLDGNEKPVIDKKNSIANLHLVRDTSEEVEKQIIFWYVQWVSKDCPRGLEDKKNRKIFEEKIGKIVQNNSEQNKTLINTEDILTEYLKTVTKSEVEEYLQGTQNLYPWPSKGDRKEVISMLISTINSLNKLELKQNIEYTIIKGLKTKNIKPIKIRGLLSAIFRSGCLLNEQDKPVLDYNGLVKKLFSTNSDDIEKKALEYCKDIISSKYKDYFKNEQNKKIFEVLYR